MFASDEEFGVKTLIEPYTRCYFSDRRYARFSCLRNGGGELIIRAHAECLIVEVFCQEIGVIEYFTPGLGIVFAVTLRKRYGTIWQDNVYFRI
jgi:hypothetical protein